LNRLVEKSNKLKFFSFANGKRRNIVNSPLIGFEKKKRYVFTKQVVQETSAQQPHTTEYFGFI